MSNAPKETIVDWSKLVKSSCKGYKETNTGWNELVKSFEKMCLEFNVNVKDVDENYRNLNDILSDLSEAWNNNKYTV